MNGFKVAIEEKNIVFGCREIGNHWKANVLQDFFEMMRFDCLIRPESNFSIAASLMKDYKVLIKPKSLSFINGTLAVTEVEIVRGW